MQVLYPNARRLEARELVTSQAILTQAERFSEVPALATVPTYDDELAYVARFSIPPAGLDRYALVLAETGGRTTAVATGRDLVELAAMVRKYRTRRHIDALRDGLPARRYGRDECRRLEARELVSRMGSVEAAIRVDAEMYPAVNRLGTAYVVVRFSSGSGPAVPYALVNRTTLEVLAEAATMSKLDRVAAAIGEDIAAGRDPLAPTWSRLVEPTDASRAFEAAFDDDQAADDARRVEDLKADPVAADHFGTYAGRYDLGELAEETADRLRRAAAGGDLDPASVAEVSKLSTDLYIFARRRRELAGIAADDGPTCSAVEGLSTDELAEAGRAYDAALADQAADQATAAAEVCELAEQVRDAARRLEESLGRPTGVPLDRPTQAVEIRAGRAFVEISEGLESENPEAAAAAVPDDDDGVSLGEDRIRAGMSGLSLADLFGAGTVTIKPAEDTGLEYVAELGRGWYLVRLWRPASPLARYNLVHAPSGLVRATATSVENLDALASLLLSYQAKPGAAIVAHQAEIVACDGDTEPSQRQTFCHATTTTTAGPATPDELREADRLEAEAADQATPDPALATGGEWEAYQDRQHHADQVAGGPYWTLALLYSDDDGKPTRYGAEYGSYNRADVVAELESLEANEQRTAVILKTETDDQAAIDAMVADLNSKRGD